MSEKMLYRYKAVKSGNSYTVHPKSETAAVTTVETLAPGDQFVVSGKVYTFVGGADAVRGSAEVGFFAVAKNGVLQFFSLSPITAAEKVRLNTHQSFTICFMAGTRIATPAGAVCVEHLAVGDLVLTAAGGSAPIRWIGRQTVSTMFADPVRVLPVRITAGSLGESLPERDLLVSPCHALLLDDVLVEAGTLVNDTTIVRETDVPTTFIYYHIELGDHSLILAEGVPAETFVDNVDRLAFDNWDEHQQACPEDRSVAELPYPRAASARQIPTSIARRIASRAALLTVELKTAA